MMSSLFMAASLSADTGKHLAIQTLARNEPISCVAVWEHVSRKFLGNVPDEVRDPLELTLAYGFVVLRSLAIPVYSFRSG